MSEEIFAKGRLFELIRVKQPDGRTFEMARRAPGVRVIIVDEPKRQILLTKEFRSELQAWDYRLPGGKVFDSLSEYKSFRESDQNILVPATTKAKAESAEEAGIEVHDISFYKKSTLGATVEWDLYVFETSDWQPHKDGQKLEHNEQIEEIGWYDFAETERMILAGEMQEHRIALVLLQWLKTRNK